MKKRTEYPIKVVDGGERLYIHPIAVSKSGANTDKIHFFNSPEFPPYSNTFLLTPSGFSYQDYNPVLLFCMRLIVIMYRYMKVAVRYKIRTHGFLRWLWDTSIPFLATCVYDDWFSVSGQLLVVDSSSLTDSDYLIPSQKWLCKKVDNWLSGNDDYFSDDIYNDQVERFTKWKTQAEGDNLEIIYLCSLDT